MANGLSTYDDSFLNSEQKKQIASFKQAYANAQAAGDQAGMSSAHAAAEKVRASAGYSGGADGSQYTALDADKTGYTAASLPTYQAQTDRVNDVYDSAAKLQETSLTGAYNSNKAALEAGRAGIAQTYQAEANTVAAENEKAKLAFNEAAAASGINSGAGSQAALAQNNVYQGNMTAVRTAEANAQTDLDNQIAQLKIQYESAVAQAQAQGAYERAASLMEEYRAQAQSAVSVAQAQANENYRAYTANYNASQDKYSRQQDELERQRSAESDSYDRAASQAATMAKYGDFSGYAELGYTGDQIAAMERTWNYQNPLLAYAMGKITAQEYYRIVYAS